MDKFIGSNFRISDSKVKFEAGNRLNNNQLKITSKPLNKS